MISFKFILLLAHVKIFVLYELLNCILAGHSERLSAAPPINLTHNRLRNDVTVRALTLWPGASSKLCASLLLSPVAPIRAPEWERLWILLSLSLPAPAVTPLSSVFLPLAAHMPSIPRGDGAT